MDIVSDHFRIQPRDSDCFGLVALVTTLMPRIRQCVECPKCLTRYLLAFSPYHNGSHLLPLASGSLEEWTLYCSCCQPRASSQWRQSELKTCEVSKAAYDRGYGTPEEIVPIVNHPQDGRSFDVSKFLGDLMIDGKTEKRAMSLEGPPQPKRRAHS